MSQNNMCMVVWWLNVSKLHVQGCLVVKCLLNLVHPSQQWDVWLEADYWSLVSSERAWNINIPGFSNSDASRQQKKALPTEAHKQVSISPTPSNPIHLLSLPHWQLLVFPPSLPSYMYLLSSTESGTYQEVKEIVCIYALLSLLFFLIIICLLYTIERKFFCKQACRYAVYNKVLWVDMPRTMTQALKVIFVHAQVLLHLLRNHFLGSLRLLILSRSPTQYSPTHCTGLHFDQREVGHES